MSEYARLYNSQPSGFEDLDYSGTLFDGDRYNLAAERLVDSGVDSYHTAHLRLGGRPEAPILETPHTPIVVDVQERALALEAIVTYLNKSSQVHGSATLLGNGGGGFSARYGTAALDVQRGAEVNRDLLRNGFVQGIKTLASTEAMHRNGMDENEIEDARLEMQMVVNRRIGVGQSDAKKRNKIVKTAQKTAKKLS